MGNTKKNESQPDPPKETLDDTLKLLIREEIERRFDAPTASLIKFIEDEVRQRIRRQEWFYWLILATVILFSSIGVSLFWNKEFKEIPAEVNRQLALAGLEESRKELTNYVANAQFADAKIKNFLVAAQVHADDVQTNLESLLGSAKLNAENINSNLLQIPSSVRTNIYIPFASRLEHLKSQDNILLVDDFSKMFIREVVTNLIDENSLVLSYEPIPSTIKLYSNIAPLGQGPGGAARFYMFEYFGYCQGRTLYLTNKPPQLISQVLDHVQKEGIVVEYVRKSLH
jgi:hypothetical protein